MMKLKEVAVEVPMFCGMEDLIEIEAVIRVLRHVRFIYRDGCLTESLSLFKLLSVPKNFELLRKKILCEEVEEEVVEEDVGHIGETVGVSCLDEEDVI